MDVLRQALTHSDIQVAFVFGKGQPYGDKAKQEVSGLLVGKSVKVETTSKDRYGRTLGRVFVDTA